MKIIGIIGVILFICFIYLLVFSICKVASDADRQMEMELQEIRKKRNKEK